MQIIVHAHSGKWYVGVKDAQPVQHYTGPQQKSQSGGKKQYRLWTGKKWGSSYASAQAFESEDAAKKYADSNKDAMEKAS